MIRRAEWKRRLRAFCIATTACFLICAVAWSFSTSRYLAQNRIGLGKIELENLDEAESQNIIQSVVNQAWESGTTPEAIRNHLLRMKGLDPNASDAPDIDTQSILDSISCQLVNADGRLQLLLSLDGRGSIVERQLIDRIAVKMASDIALLPIEKLVSVEKSINEVPAPVHQVASSLTSSITATRAARRTADSLAADLENLKSEMAVSNENDVRAMQVSASLLDDLTSEVQRLVQLKENLEFQKQGLEGLPETEPRYRELQSQLLGIDDKITELENRILVQRNKAQSSPFRSASYSKSKPAVTVNSALADELSDSLGRLDRELLQLQSQLQQPSSSPKTDSGEIVPVFVRSFEKARIVPRNGIRFLGPFLLLCMVSTLVGSVIAYKFKPLAEDTGFETPQQITELLRAPIVAQIPAKKESAETEERDELPWPNLAVKAGELVVLTALAMIACMMLFSPSIRASFAENPMHGLSEILWRIQGK